MVYKYSFQEFNKETMARASGTNLKISLKKTVETAREIQGKKVSTVIDFLEKVQDLKAVVPYRKYRAEVAHKRGKGIDTGGFPTIVAKELLVLIKSAQKNAIEAEISGDLFVLSVSGRKGNSRYHPGRHSGRSMKATNVEVIVGLKEKKATKKVAEVAKKND